MPDVTRGRTFRFESDLAASPDALWAHATSMRGVNHELAPLVRMTYPRSRAVLTANEIRLGERMFRSWILLFGVLPIDWDDLRFVAIEPGRRFLERSAMATQRIWEHERTIEAIPGGARIADRVRFEPCVAWLGALQAPLFRLVFRWRHARLRRRFGVHRAPPPARTRRAPEAA